MPTVLKRCDFVCDFVFGFFFGLFLFCFCEETGGGGKGGLDCSISPGCNRD